MTGTAIATMTEIGTATMTGTETATATMTMTEIGTATCANPAYVGHLSRCVPRNVDHGAHQ
jgi:hypothetical protein